jgi:hypothetical protein
VILSILKWNRAIPWAAGIATWSSVADYVVYIKRVGSVNALSKETFKYIMNNRLLLFSPLGTIVHE